MFPYLLKIGEHIAKKGWESRHLQHQAIILNTMFKVFGNTFLRVGVITQTTQITKNHEKVPFLLSLEFKK